MININKYDSDLNNNSSFNPNLINFKNKYFAKEKVNDTAIENNKIAGYSKMKNILLEKIMRSGFSKNQLLIILAVFRKTTGYNKQSDWISNKQLQALTGVFYTHCSAVKNELVRMNVLVKSANRVSINENVEEWSVKAEIAVTKDAKCSLQKQVNKDYRNSKCNITESVITDSANFALLKPLTTKDNTTKNIKTKKDVLKNIKKVQTALSSFANAKLDEYQCEEISFLPVLVEEEQKQPEEITPDTPPIDKIPQNAPRIDFKATKAEICNNDAIEKENAPELILEPSTSIVKKSNKKPKSDIDAATRQVFEHWKSTMKTPRSVFDKKRELRIKARLNEGFTADELCKAIEGATHSDFHMGINDQGTPYKGVEHVLRDAAQVERFIAMYESPPIITPKKPILNHNDTSYIDDLVANGYVDFPETQEFNTTARVFDHESDFSDCFTSDFLENS